MNSRHVIRWQLPPTLGSNSPQEQLVNELEELLGARVLDLGALVESIGDLPGFAKLVQQKATREYRFGDIGCDLLETVVLLGASALRQALNEFAISLRPSSAPVHFSAVAEKSSMLLVCDREIRNRTKEVGIYEADKGSGCR